MRKRIRLTESDLQRLLRESIKKVLEGHSFIDGDVRLSLELHRNDDGFGIWLGDDCGSSGIEVSGSTPKEAVAHIVPYLEDYFYERQLKPEFPCFDATNKGCQRSSIEGE